MKFYYNGQLIRTSKNHHYTHACIEITENGIRCIGCSSTKAGAEKMKAREISELERYMFSHKACIKALEERKRGYYNKRHEFISFSGSDFDIESEKRYLEDDKRRLARFQKWQIVELEVR